MRVRNPWISALSLSLLCAALAELPAQRRGNRRDRERTPVELQNFTYQTASFLSTALDGDEVRYAVYLPKGYGEPENADRRYPLVIWLHGMFENHERFHYRGGAPVLDRVVGEEKVPQMIVVGPDGGRSFYINGKDSGRYEDLITKDLLAQVEQKYRVSKNRNSRALMGISMGGMGALKIALKHPDLFGTVAVHSAAVFPIDPEDLPDRFKQWGERLGMDRVFGEPIDVELWRAENPLYMASQTTPKMLAGLRIYFDAGTEDRFQFHRSNTMLHKALEKQGIDHSWHMVDGGGHAWGSGFQKSSLEQSLVFVGEAFTAAEGAEAGRRALQGLQESGTGDGKGNKSGKKDG